MLAQAAKNDEVRKQREQDTGRFAFSGGRGGRRPWLRSVRAGGRQAWLALCMGGSPASWHLLAQMLAAATCALNISNSITVYFIILNCQ